MFSFSPEERSDARAWSTKFFGATTSHTLYTGHFVFIIEESSKRYNSTVLSFLNIRDGLSCADRYNVDNHIL